MADFVTNGEKAFPISANVAQYIRVKVTTTLQNGVPIVSAAGIADVTAGVSLRAGFVTTGPIGQTINSVVPVRLSSAQGTIIVTNNADGAITVGGAVYSAATGKVSGSQGTGAILLGYNIGAAAAADGDLVELLPL